MKGKERVVISSGARNQPLPAAFARLISRSARNDRRLVLLVLLVAFLVRAYGLAAQSLWNDEGTSVALAHLSLSAIASGAAHDIHPPLYYFLLHFWMIVAGDGEFAVRFLSLIAGVLLVAVTARLAFDLFGRRVAVLAALPSALSAFQVYYSQETRMYIWVALWSAISMWAMARLLRRRGDAETGRQGEAERRGHRESAHLRVSASPRRLWLAYILSTLAALYTHYYAPTIILAQDLFFVVWLVVAWRPRTWARFTEIRSIVLPWIASQAVVALAFLPWILYAGNQLSSWPAVGDHFELPDLVYRILSAFALGIDEPLASQLWILAYLGLLFGLGIFAGLARSAATRADPKGLVNSSGLSVLLLLLWCVTPLAFMYAASFNRPAYNPKFLLLATPPFYIFIAAGISSLLPHARSAGLVAFARAAAFAAASLVLVAAAGFALQGVYSDPRLQRDDYRGVLAYINQHATERDAVLVDAPGQIDVVRYYYHGAARLVALPVGRPMSRVPTDDVLRDLTGFRDNVFAIYWATEQADPDRYVEQMLAAQKFEATDEWHGNVRLAQYGGMEGGKSFLRQEPIQFGDDLILQGVTRFGPDPVYPGRVMSLALSWQAGRRIESNYKVFVHLLDSQGQIVSQRDVEPVAGWRPTAGWNQGEYVQDNVGLLIRPGTPLGEYTLELGVYQPESGTRLTLPDGSDHLMLGTVRVEQ